MNKTKAEIAAYIIELNETEKAQRHKAVKADVKRIIEIQKGKA